MLDDEYIVIKKAPPQTDCLSIVILLVLIIISIFTLAPIVWFVSKILTVSNKRKGRASSDTLLMVKKISGIISLIYIGLSAISLITYIGHGVILLMT